MERVFVGVEIEINRSSTTTNKKSEKANHDARVKHTLQLCLQMVTPTSSCWLASDICFSNLPINGLKVRDKEQRCSLKRILTSRSSQKINGISNSSELSLHMRVYQKSNKCGLTHSHRLPLIYKDKYDHILTKKITYGIR